MVNGDWSAQRDRIYAMVATPQLNRRRTAFMAQLCAEAAGAFDDVETSSAMVDRAVTAGIFDLHWLERCPLLGGVRALPSYPRTLGRIKRRADAVLDALYGEVDEQHSADLSDTVAG
jgi:serine/threonine-protein kinase